jgi:hypothetical protein
VGLFHKLKQAASQVQGLTASISDLNAEAASARAEWGDGGTARPGWGSAGGAGSHVATGGDAIAAGAIGYGRSTTPAEGAVEDDDVAQLHALTEDLRGILASGAPGTAIVTAVRDSGERVARHALANFDLNLRPGDGTDERSLSVRLPVCGTSLRGHDDRAERPVRFDPSDRRRLAFVWQGSPRGDGHRTHVKTRGFRGQSIDLVGLLPGRALLDGYTSVLQPGEVSNSVKTDLHVRLRLPGGALGARTACGHLLDWKPIKLLERGLDVPVAVDPSTGSLEDVLVDALTDELRPRFAGLSATDQMLMEPIREVRNAAGDWVGTAKKITSKEIRTIPSNPEDGGFAPGDPILAPANGVTFEQWVAVSAGIIRGEGAQGDADAYAQIHGVPAGAWTEGARQWRRRQVGHPMMAEKYGRALARAQKHE